MLAITAFEFLLVAFTTIFGTTYNVKFLISSKSSCSKRQENVAFQRIDRALIVSYGKCTFMFSFT